MPDIRAEGDHIVFEFAVAIGERPRRLMLRCTQDGSVLAAIEAAPAPQAD
jgi:hypothetical protein